MGHSAQQMKHENVQKFSPILRPDFRPSHKKFVAAISLWGRSGVRKRQWMGEHLSCDFAGENVL